MCPTAHVPYCPCALLPHVPHPPRSHICICSINQGTIYPCAHCPCVKKMSSCQKDVKLSKRCQMSKSQTHRLWRRFTKKINWHNEVHTYWRQFWRQIWRSPKLFKNTFYAHFEGFWWPSYVMSKIDINMCEPHYVNLFFLWTSSIVYVFDFLTFDIFLTIWHLFDNLTSFWHFDISFNLNHLSPSQGYFVPLFLFFWPFCTCPSPNVRGSPRIFVPQFFVPHFCSASHPCVTFTLHNILFNYRIIGVVRF